MIETNRRKRMGRRKGKGKRRRLESDRELLDRMEKTAGTTRLYGVVDYGIRKEFYRTMCGYSPKEQFENFFPIGQVLSATMMRAQYAVTEKLYKDCLKSLDGRLRERLGKLSFEFTKEGLAECLKNTRALRSFTKGDHSKIVAVFKGEREPETNEERQKVEACRENIEFQSHRTVLFKAVEKLCGEAEYDKIFQKGDKVKYAVATVKSIKTVFDSGRESEILSSERKAFFESFGYAYFPVRKCDIRKGLAERIVADYLMWKGITKLAETA